MKFVSNAGQERVIDLLRPGLKPGHQLDIVSPAYSLFAFAEVLADATHLAHTRLITPPESADLALLGSPADRTARNRLQVPWLARQFAHWIAAKAEVYGLALLGYSAAIASAATCVVAGAMGVMRCHALLQCAHPDHMTITNRYPLVLHCEASLSRIVEMAWEDRTAFEAIEAQFGLNESAVVALMRRRMLPSSFRMWRQRMAGRKTKHAALRDANVFRHRATHSRQ